jgi:hypothetical protein
MYHHYDSADYEAKRKKHQTCDKEETVEKHSAQIFCEMLAQVFLKEFWEIDRIKYHDVHRLPLTIIVDDSRLLLFIPRTIFSISTTPNSRIHTFPRLPTMAPTSDSIPRNASRYTALENITCDQGHIGSTSSRTMPSFYGISPVERLTSDICSITMIIRCINMYWPLFCC